MCDWWVIVKIYELYKNVIIRSENTKISDIRNETLEKYDE